MPYESVTRENIEEMVFDFYGRVLKDDILAPFFIKALGENLEGGKWIEHLNTLKDFWVLMMTGKAGYRGDPFPAHAFLGNLTRESFERWLMLFKEVVYRLYIPEIADKFYQKADILAEQFIEGLGIDDDDDEW